MNVILPKECPTVSAVLGFGSKDAITPPKVRNTRGTKEYIYDIKHITAADVSHLNLFILFALSCSFLNKLYRENKFILLIKY